MTRSKSMMFSPATVAAMLMEAEKNGFPLKEWRAINDGQERFLELMPSYHKQIVENGIPEMKGIFALSSTEIEDFLRENGMEMQIPPFVFPSQVGIASLMEIQMKWLVEAQVVTIRMGETKNEIENKVLVVDGIRLEMGVTHFQVGMEQFVTSVGTKTGDKIYVAATNKAPEDIFDLVSTIDELFSLAKPDKYSQRYRDIAFPMVCAKEEMFLEWLKGFQLGKGAFINFAVQKNELAVDEFGAIVRSAAVGSITLGISHSPPPPLVIRSPFLIWVERNGVVIFYGYIEEDNWKRPPKTIK